MSSESYVEVLFARKGILLTADGQRIMITRDELVSVIEETREEAREAALETARETAREAALDAAAWDREYRY